MPTPQGRVATLEEAVAGVPSEAVLYIGGAGLSRKPLALLRALVAAGRRDLTAVTFVGSLDVELLLAGGVVREIASAYVGLGEHGFAPRFRAAAEQALVVDREHSEWTLLGGLRAAAMGVPFLPTRAGEGSEVVASLGHAEISDPYGGGRYRAIPPLVPDVTVLHAWRATATGEVQMPWPGEHLWDVDVLAARAARHVVVTVEELVSAEQACADAHLTRLFGFEVDAVVPLAGGAWPTGCAPAYDCDGAVVAAYAASGGDVALLSPHGHGP